MLGIALAAVGAADSWPRSSRRPVQPLPRPTVEARAAALRPDATHGYSFAVFGDQRALMGGGWRRLLRSIDAQAARNERLLFMVDTGDFVEDGSYNDQFALVADLLGEVRRLPYVVGVGNHEVDGNRPGPARENLARFLSSLGTPIGPDRLYYAMTVGRVRFLFLDSNDLVYDGSGAEAGRVAARAAAQMEWLSRELRNPAFGADATTVVVMHHPLIQSSAKHRGQSRALWSYTWKGRRLPDLLADGGVDLVLSGHTHTYERFRMAREDGRGFVLLNLSGTPEPSFLWFGAGARRARNIQGSEKPWLYDRGWRGLEEWEITQEDVMDENESNQYGLFTVDADGGISLEMRFLDRPAPEPPVRLVWGVPASLRLEGHE
jgi:hypothetical protein